MSHLGTLVKCDICPEIDKIGENNEQTRAKI